MTCGGKAAGWNPEAYAAVSIPQQTWARKIVDSLELRGEERVIDIGCGSGEVTKFLLDRLPSGFVLATDVSQAMIEKAAVLLSERYGQRVGFRSADALEVTDEEEFDLAFSAATFHWVLDHARLFRQIFRLLKPNGRLRAQYAGAGNLGRVRNLAPLLMQKPEFRDYFVDWHDTWYYATPEADAADAAKVGFLEIRTWVELEPTSFPSPQKFRDYLEHVVCRDYLALLPEPGLRRSFLDQICEHADTWEQPYTLDYVRMNIEARKPA